MQKHNRFKCLDYWLEKQAGIDLSLLSVDEAEDILEAVFLAMYQYGRSLSEIGRYFGVSGNAIKSHLAGRIEMRGRGGNNNPDGRNGQ